MTISNNVVMNKVAAGECELMVYVFQRPHMRSEMLHMELYVGKGVLDNIFEPNPQTRYDEEIFLSFPERWLNVVEERSLFARIGIYYPHLKKLTIKTHSVYIIQCCRSEYIRIVTPQSFDKSGLPQESDEGVLYLDDCYNMFSTKGINVVGGSVK